MKTEIKTYDEMVAFVQPLIDEAKWAIDIKELDEGAGYAIQWIEHKNYTAHDGNTFPDELWETEAGELKLVQDLEPEHARNVLRMLLRQERVAREQLQAMAQKMFAAIQAEDLDDDFQDISTIEEEHRTLH